MMRTTPSVPPTTPTPPAGPSLDKRARRAFRRTGLKPVREVFRYARDGVGRCCLLSVLVADDFVPAEGPAPAPLQLLGRLPDGSAVMSRALGLLGCSRDYAEGLMQGWDQSTRTDRGGDWIDRERPHDPADFRRGYKDGRAAYFACTDAEDPCPKESPA
jgi:hypothetical protein